MVKFPSDDTVKLLEGNGYRIKYNRFSALELKTDVHSADVEESSEGQLPVEMSDGKENILEGSEESPFVKALKDFDIRKDVHLRFDVKSLPVKFLF